jgi:hypothetical protein
MSARVGQTAQSCPRQAAGTLGSWEELSRFQGLDLLRADDPVALGVQPGSNHPTSRLVREDRRRDVMLNFLAEVAQ